MRNSTAWPAPPILRIIKFHPFLIRHLVLYIAMDGLDIVSYLCVECSDWIGIFEVEELYAYQTAISPINKC